MAKQDNYTRYTIRVPQELYASLDEAATAANRSVNAEIVERLSYAVAHPPSEYESMSEALQDLDAQLDQAYQRNDALNKHVEVLNAVTDQEFDFQLRLMYHVLSYVEKIPLELAVWAYDLIAAIERNEFMAEVYKNKDLSEAEIRTIIQIKRDNRQGKLFKEIVKHLEERFGDPASK